MSLGELLGTNALLRGTSHLQPEDAAPTWGETAADSTSVAPTWGETAAASTSPAPSMDTIDAVFLLVTSSAILIMASSPHSLHKILDSLGIGPLCWTHVPHACSAPSSAKQEANPNCNKGLC